MKILETPRLILRPWLLSDLDDFYAYAKVEGVGEMAGWPHHKNREESQEILKGFMENPLESAVILKETGRAIGSLGLRRVGAEEENQWEIGYVLAKEHWGRGLMPEAVTEMLSCLFEEMGAQVVWCGHFESNSQSRRVIEKCGFHFWDSYIYQAKQLEKEFLSKKYRITKEEYWAGRTGSK